MERPTVNVTLTITDANVIVEALERAIDPRSVRRPTNHAELVNAANAVADALIRYLGERAGTLPCEFGTPGCTAAYWHAVAIGSEKLCPAHDQQRRTQRTLDQALAEVSSG